jgi:hypothetical protein
MNLNISTIVAGAALSAFAVVLSLMSGNKTDIISALIAAGLCTAFVSTTAVELANETSNLKALKNADDTMQDTHNDFSKDQINQFRQ